MGADNVHAIKGERMYDTGSTTFMLICTMLVFLMTPGLAFFYGGLSRRKNVINTMLMCFGAIGLVGVLWIVAGWSLAYGGDGSSPFIGGLDQLLCLPVLNQVLQAAEGNAADGVVYPQIINIAFQMAFAMITAAIVTGSLAGRVKFGAMTAFLGIWLLVVYAPLAHMVWGGEGSFIGDIIGALDFAGGDVVHISSGLTGLILCLMLGRRRGFGMVSYRPHNVPFVALGAGLLWFGWFGFNGGSEFKADAVAALAILNTVTASAAGMVSWLAVERVHTGRPTLVGASTGLVAGLVVVTPGAGFVEPWAALVMGLIVSPVCYLAISHLKTKFGYDDALDAFGCHGIGGILGELSITAPPAAITGIASCSFFRYCSTSSMIVRRSYLAQSLMSKPKCPPASGPSTTMKSGSRFRRAVLRRNSCNARTDETMMPSFASRKRG